MKSETKPASSKSTPVPAKVKEETKKSDTRKSFFGASSAPNKPKDETKAAPTPTDAEKPSSTAPVKKPAPALKRGGSGIMQAFSKAATKVKKTDASQPATPSGDDSTAQPLSDDGEDDEVEMPKARVSATSGRKSKKEREEELRRMMEEDDEEEEEEELEEREESPPEEPVEEPVVEEPVKEEKTEVVSASSDGRRRGKRRVMRKKQIMDDQGYLGKCPFSLSFTVGVCSMLTLDLQSRYKNLVGSLSQKMRRRPPQSRRRQARLLRPLQQSRRKPVPKWVRAVSCPSFPRNDHILECIVSTLGYTLF